MLTISMQVTSSAPVRVAVFGSGAGSLADALIRKGARSDAFRVVLLVSSKSDSGIVQVGQDHGVPVVIEPPGDRAAAGEWMLAVLKAQAVDVIALAGYLRLIPEAVVRAFEGRMFNTHPALLPRHGGPGMYGLRVHRAVLEAGDRVSGATIHRVTARYDEGEIVAQESVEVDPADDAERLQERVKGIERRLYPDVLERICRERNF